MSAYNNDCDAHSSTSLEQEWQRLHANFQQYEALGYGVKAVAVLAFVFGDSSLPWLLAALIGVLWLHEGMVKTAQNRVSRRLLVIERALIENTSRPAFQHHSEFEAERGGAAVLLKTYLLAALKPTVAVLYMALLALVFMPCVFNL